MKQPSVETKIAIDDQKWFEYGKYVSETLKLESYVDWRLRTQQAQMREKIKKLGEESDRDDGYVTWICLEDVLAIIEEKR
jgi:hypothetical protein